MRAGDAKSLTGLPTEMQKCTLHLGGLLLRTAVFKGFTPFLPDYAEVVPLSVIGAFALLVIP